MDNAVVLESVFNKRKRGTVRQIMVTADDLTRSGWVGRLPTEIFTKLEGYWVRYERGLRKYKIVKVDPSMLNTMRPKSQDTNAPLPITGGKKFNLKNLYKQNIVDANKPKDGKK
jgi:hypothetical protein